MFRQTRLLTRTSIFAAIVIAGSLLARPALAERLESDSYVIQFGNFNVTAGEKSNENYKVTDTVGQTGAGPYGQYGVSGYFVGGGFQYIYQIKNFRFSISKLAIDFGTLTPNVHATDSHTLLVNTRSHGYQVYAYEAHPLEHRDDPGTYIPNTGCNSGTCTNTNAGVWTTQTIPGFGFNVSGDGTPADFVDTTYFRPFADASSAEDMQIVMSSPNIAINESATVTYKAGISNNQAAGEYETYVVYVAVPSY